jgi:hypothetical protein
MLMGAGYAPESYKMKVSLISSIFTFHIVLKFLRPSAPQAHLCCPNFFSHESGPILPFRPCVDLEQLVPNPRSLLYFSIKTGLRRRSMHCREHHGVLFILPRTNLRHCARRRHLVQCYHWNMGSSISLEIYSRKSNTLLSDCGRGKHVRISSFFFSVLKLFLEKISTFLTRIISF